MLHAYCVAPGQKVNLQKSSVYFSLNIPTRIKEELCQILGMTRVENPGKYLGMPIIWGKSKKEALNYVKEKMLRKI